MRRMYARTEDRDTATTWATREAQYDAVCAWGIPDHALLQRPSGLQLPVFVANGDSDPMILPHYSYLLAGLIPQARVKIYSNSTHGFLFQHHAEFAADIEAFLSDPTSGIRRRWTRCARRDRPAAGRGRGAHRAHRVLRGRSLAGLTALAPGAAPDETVQFAVLGYAITSMETETYRPSRLILLGEDASPELRWSTSLDSLVTPASPPLFVWHTAEDAYVPPEHTYRLASALAARGVPHAVHVFAHGPHGLGLAQNAGETAVWTTLAEAWIHEQAAP